MAFQEPVDPLVESLQNLIDDLKQNIHSQEFKKTLDSIDEQFPFVNLIEFLDMYVDGKYTPELIETFHLVGYADLYKLLQILKLPKHRPSKDNTSLSRQTNLSDNHILKRYEFLRSALQPFEKIIKERILYNILRAIVIFQLFSNDEKFTTESNLLENLPNAIKDFERLVKTPHDSLENIPIVEIQNSLKLILDELQTNLFLENNDSQFRLETHQLLFADYIFNIIENRPDGIVYQDLLKLIQEKLPIFTKIPLALIEISLEELRARTELVAKVGYWKLKPYFDQYFTFENYRKLNHSDSSNRSRKFFGRKITPDEFIHELLSLEKGDFEDQDDQVTRIAGMVLTNSNMMSHPPNTLDDFDFVVDLSNYEFTKEQESIIQNLNIQITSNIIFIKVMINEEITVKHITELLLKLQNRKKNEQGFLISFEEPEQKVSQILEKNKTLQIISKNELKQWCEITPVIPSRRGSVAIVRQGDHRNSIVKIDSINYESGRADIVLFPKFSLGTQYIGSLEEISLDVSVDQFIDASNIYFQFLGKLRSISKTDVFRKIISDGLFSDYNQNVPPQLSIFSHLSMECNFGTINKSEIDLHTNPNGFSLKYSFDDIFSCTCYQWNYHSRTHGLCEHLIFTLDELIKILLSEKEKLLRPNKEKCLRKIEQRMDLFLDRLRYCSSNDTSNVAKCPNCGIVKNTIRDVESTFGYRQMNPDDKFSLRRQSRCKKCR